jgi:hypothetical protein
MAQIYCGNNAMDINLLNGNKVLGTPYKCLRQGVGKGLSLPYDAKYAGAYMPIDQRQIYCGNQPELPDGYDSMGSLPQCLQKGIGIGKRQRAEQGPPRFMLFVRIILPVLIFLLVAGGLFSVLYFEKPSIVTLQDKKEIDWGKFMAFYVPTVILVGILIFLLWNFWVLKKY